MTPPEPRFYFDFADPISYLLALEVDAVERTPGAPRVQRVPFELNPPPRPLIDPDGDAWRRRWNEAVRHAEALGVVLTPPVLIPWTRKAHELVLHATGHGLEMETHRAVFRAAFEQGRDIGRIDVLLEVTRDLGLDLTETKAVLDVDRHAASVASLRDEAEAAEVDAPATLTGPAGTLRGFHNRHAVGTFLLRGSD